MVCVGLVCRIGYSLRRSLCRKELLHVTITCRDLRTSRSGRLRCLSWDWRQPSHAVALCVAGRIIFRSGWRLPTDRPRVRLDWDVFAGQAAPLASLARCV
ncbi:unnamed protein product, partial [Mycena citricolor]